MIRALVLYPRGEGTTFDGDYWVNTHMSKLVAGLPGVAKWEADLAADDSPYHAAAHIYFDSPEDMGKAFGGPQGAEVMADVANYTNIAPVMSMNQVAASS